MDDQNEVSATMACCRLSSPFPGRQTGGAAFPQAGPTFGRVRAADHDFGILGRVWLAWTRELGQSPDFDVWRILRLPLVVPDG